MEVHIGEEIEKQFQNSGLKIDAFAEKINTGVRNVYSLFRRKDISIEMLTNISKALKYNFLALYESQMPNLLSEPDAKYRRDEKAITLSVEISGKLDNMGQFPELIKEMSEAAIKRGFRII